VGRDCGGLGGEGGWVSTLYGGFLEEQDRRDRERREAEHLHDGKLYQRVGEKDADKLIPRDRTKWWSFGLEEGGNGYTRGN